MVRIIGIVVLLMLSLVMQPAAAQTNRQVYAFYFGWWTSESWGDGRLVDRPAAPYDSRDAGALGRHIDEARGAGIDAFIMSWFGPKNDNLTHQVFNMLLDQASARGFKAGASVDMHEAGYNATVDEVIGTLNYLINDRANHPGYLRYDGKPVIYFWNQGRFSVSDWTNIRNQVDPNRGTIWVMEGTDTSFLAVFDGLYLFNTAWSGNPAATAAQWQGATQAAGGWFYTPTVLPGWDESRMAGRDNPTAPQDRSGGEFLANSWNGAASSGASVILIVSWNEYFENSHIEPSQSFGTLALDTLRPLIGAWKGGYSAPMTASGATSTNDSGPRVLRPNNSWVNVRAGAGTDFEKIGEIRPGEVYAITGEAAGWYSFDFNGQTGWVFSGLVVASGGGADTTVSSAPAGAPTGISFTVNFIANFRSAPGEGSSVLAQIPYQTALEVTGRNADNTWVQVNFNGQNGWVAARLGSLSADLNAAPVVG